MFKIMRITTVPVSLLILLKKQLQFIGQHFQIVAISSAGKELDKLTQDTGIRTIALEMTRKVTPLKDAISLLKLIGQIRKERPFIVHTHTPKAGLLGMMAAKIMHVPVRLHTVAGLPLLEKRGLLKQILILTEKITYKCATKVYPNSAGMLDILVKNKYCAKEKLKVIGKGSSNGVDTTHFDPAIFLNKRLQICLELGLANTDFIYCYIGRIVADKGIHELIGAFIKISAANTSAKLLLVGPFENDLDPLNKSTNQKIHSNPAIILVGFVEDVRPYLAIAQVFVFPSYREGFPNVLMQAGSMGVPCITTDINGCNEIVNHGVNGLIVPVKDTVALYNSMHLLYNNKVLLEFLAANTRNKIIADYESHYVMNELLQEYQYLVSTFDKDSTMAVI